MKIDQIGVYVHIVDNSTGVDSEATYRVSCKPTNKVLTITQNKSNSSDIHVNKCSTTLDQVVPDPIIQKLVTFALSGGNAALFNVASGLSPWTGAPRKHHLLETLKLLEQLMSEGEQEYRVYYTLLGVTDRRCVNLVKEKPVPIEHLLEAPEKVYSQIESIDEITDRFHHEFSLPFILSIRLTTNMPVPRSGHLCIFDLGSPVLDPRASLPDRAHVSQSVQALYQVASLLGTGTLGDSLPVDKFPLTSFAAEFIGGHAKTLFLFHLASAHRASGDLKNVLDFIRVLQMVRCREVRNYVDHRVSGYYRRFQMYKQSCQDLEVKVSKLTATLQTCRDEAEQLNDSLEMQRRAYQGKEAQLHKEAQIATSASVEHAQQVAQLQKHLSKEQKLGKQLTEQLHQREEDISRLTQKLERTQQTYGENSQAYKTLQHQYNTLEKKCRELEERLTKQVTEITELQHERDQLQAQLDTYSSKSSKLSQCTDELSERCRRLQDEKLQLYKQNVEERRRLEDEKSQLYVQYQELDAILTAERERYQERDLRYSELVKQDMEKQHLIYQLESRVATLSQPHIQPEPETEPQLKSEPEPGSEFVPLPSTEAPRKRSSRSTTRAAKLAVTSYYEETSALPPTEDSISLAPPSPPRHVTSKKKRPASSPDPSKRKPVTRKRSKVALTTSDIQSEVPPPVPVVETSVSLPPSTTLQLPETRHGMVTDQESGNELSDVASEVSFKSPKKRSSPFKARVERARRLSGLAIAPPPLRLSVNIPESTGQISPRSSPLAEGSSIPSDTAHLVAPKKSRRRALPNPSASSSQDKQDGLHVNTPPTTPPLSEHDLPGKAVVSKSSLACQGGDTDTVITTQTTLGKKRRVKLGRMSSQTNFGFSSITLPMETSPMKRTNSKILGAFSVFGSKKRGNG
ncbi:hypothetical protein IWQ61_003503 [Dispira simplex]|nr:hypothetical protein IWQ61_003503 [Dispira simplex]